MNNKNKDTSAEEKLDKIIKEKSEKNKILKKLLKEINKETAKDSRPDQK